METPNIGITIADIGTGEWEIKDCLTDADDQYQALDEVSRYINTYNPVEIVISVENNVKLDSNIIKYL